MSDVHANGKKLNALKKQVDKPKKPEKLSGHNGDGKSAPGRKQMTALWIAVATALGSTGVPKIVELIEDKPSTNQVQMMIAHQTEQLTEQLNKTIDALKEADDQIDNLRNKYLELYADSLRTSTDIRRIEISIKECCTKKSIRRRLGKPHALTKDDLNFLLPRMEKKATTGLKKLPSFNIQQQLQKPQVETVENTPQEKVQEGQK